jgi:hypothetical protein
MGCVTAGLPGGVEWTEHVQTLDLGTERSASDPLVILASEYNTYTLLADPDAVVWLRINRSSQEPYNAGKLCLRRGAPPFGRLYLHWPAQAGKTAQLVLGVNEEVGIR